MTTPTIPYYPITHDDGLDIVDALEAIKNAISADPVWGSIIGTLSDQTDLQNALSAKAPLASPALAGTPTAPTAGTATNTTQIATTEFVQKHAPIHLSVTASAGNSASKSDSRITATMRVIHCVFGTPANVASNVTWTTSAGSIAFSGTFTGSTTIDFDLVESN